MGIFVHLFDKDEWSKARAWRAANPKKHSAFYESYMKSDEWKAKRKERLVMDDYTCVVCKRKLSDDKLKGDHLVYARLGNERMEDLQTICLTCDMKKEKGKGSKGYDHSDKGRIEGRVRGWAKKYRPPGFVEEVGMAQAELEWRECMAAWGLPTDDPRPRQAI